MIKYHEMEKHRKKRIRKKYRKKIEQRKKDIIAFWARMSIKLEWLYSDEPV